MGVIGRSDVAEFEDRTVHSAPRVSAEFCLVQVWGRLAVGLAQRDGRGGAPAQAGAAASLRGRAGGRGCRGGCRAAAARGRAPELLRRAVPALPRLLQACPHSLIWLNSWM